MAQQQGLVSVPADTCRATPAFRRSMTILVFSKLADAEVVRNLIVFWLRQSRTLVENSTMAVIRQRWWHRGGKACWSFKIEPHGQGVDLNKRSGKSGISVVTTVVNVMLSSGCHEHHQ